MKYSELTKKLRESAGRETWTDDPTDFDPCSFSSGNYDDAYYGGLADGRTEMAREILKELEEN